MSGARLALYRKYRSSNFDEVIGQDHITKTLLAAIAGGRTSHAYLFSGPRGTGKTSVARLLAAALNCTGSPKPCGKCPHCTESGLRGLDIIEIDGASNRGIDEIRDLRDKVNVAPSGSQFKVYIIDEVHMLTDPAFNALLKTLEEPPSHVVFILATTEAHKLPATIISRTQHFQFRAIATSDLVSRLTTIAETEDITIEIPALERIAEQSAGGFRDAIGMLDQLAGSTTGNITLVDVERVLGLANASVIERLTEAVTTGNPSTLPGLISELETAGYSPSNLTSQLLQHWQQRLATVLSTNTTGKAADISEAVRLVAGIQALLAMPKTSWPWLSLEAALVGLSLPAAAPTTLAPVPATAAAASAPASAPAKPAPAPPTALDSDLWTKALVQVKTHNNSLFALLKSCTVQPDGDRYLITTRFNFHRDRLEEPKNRTIIESCLDKVYGRKLRLIIQVEAGAAPPPAPKDDESELVTSALEILGGEVVYE